MTPACGVAHTDQIIWEHQRIHSVFDRALSRS